MREIQQVARSESRLARRWTRLQKLGDLAPRFSIAAEFGRVTGDEFYRAYPFKRNLRAILISVGFLVVFSIPLFGVSQTLPDADGELFSLVSTAFSLFWMLGWSVGVTVIALVFLAICLGRETLHVREGNLILRIGIPGLGLGLAYPGAMIRNFRTAEPDEKAGSGWRGEHLVFSFADEEVAFASNITGSAAEQELQKLRALFPSHDQALPENLPEPEPEFVKAGASAVVTSIRRAELPAHSRHGLGSLSSLALIAANLVPLVGVLLLGWDIGELMLLYWAESAVIGFYTLLKMARVGKWSVLFFGPFFTGHYGGFMAGHLLFIYGLFINDPNAGTDIPLWQVFGDFISLLPALAAFFISHGVSYMSNFIGRREFAFTDIRAQMGQPYKRIIIMHLTIIFGGFLVMALGSTLPALLLMIVLKLGADLGSHLKEHARLGGEAETPATA